MATLSTPRRSSAPTARSTGAPRRSPWHRAVAAGATLAVAAAALAAGSGAAAPVAAAVTAPPAEALSTHRLAGADRVTTALTVAGDRFPAGYPAVVLARGDDFADALAGAALAHQVGGPLLLTGRSELDPRVARDLAARLSPGGTAWLLGQTSALGADVATAVRDLGFTDRRVAGDDRYGTAAAVAREVTADAAGPCDVVLATGRGFADGAASSGLLTGQRPLLFTDGDALPPATVEVLEACARSGGGAVTAVGGAAATAVQGAGLAPALTVAAVHGSDRYATSARLLLHQREGRGSTRGPVVLATGEDYADPLVGGSYGHPVLLTGADGLPPSVADALGKVAGTVAGLVVVGGEAAVSGRAARAAAASVTGEPTGDPADLDAGWLAAWRTGDHEVLRAWFAGQGFGPDTVTGTHPGGRVTTQADADALRGKRVTGTVTVRGDVTISDVHFDGARVDVTGGRVTFSDVLHDARGGTRYPNYFRIFGRGGADTRVHLERVEIRNGQDGVQSAGTEVSGRFVYVHSVAPSTGALSGNNTHQDGWQHMRGTLDVERSFIDYSGARTSVLMLKPDHGPMTSVSVNRTVLQGGGPIVFHVHDAGSNTIGAIDLSDNLVAGAPGRTLASVWKVNPGVVEQLRATTVTASPSGRALSIRDAAKLP